MVTLAVDGNDAGAWRGREEGGDILDFTAHALFAGNRQAAFTWAVSWLGYDPANTIQDADRIFDDVEARRRDRHRGIAANDAERAEFRDGVRSLWESASPALVGTAAATYLHRLGIPGFDPKTSLRAAPLAPLRYHEKCWHPDRRRHEPALVAALSDELGQLKAVLRTWLRLDAAPWPGHAPSVHAYEPALTFGDIVGAAVRFGDPIAQVWDICIDVEHGLRLHLAHPDHHVLVAVRAENLVKLFIPIGLTKLRICTPLTGSYTGNARHILRARLRWLEKIGGTVEFVPLNESLQCPPKVRLKEMPHE